MTMPDVLMRRGVEVDKFIAEHGTLICGALVISAFGSATANLINANPHILDGITGFLKQLGGDLLQNHAAHLLIESDLKCTVDTVTRQSVFGVTDVHGHFVTPSTLSAPAKFVTEDMGASNVFIPNGLVVPAEHAIQPPVGGINVNGNIVTLRVALTECGGPAAQWKNLPLPINPYASTFDKIAVMPPGPQASSTATSIFIETPMVRK